MLFNLVGADGVYYRRTSELIRESLGVNLGPLYGIISDGPILSFEHWEYNPYQGQADSITNDSWTPMVSLKYNLHDHLLTGLGLDEAMAYLRNV